VPSLDILTPECSSAFQAAPGKRRFFAQLRRETTLNPEQARRITAVPANRGQSGWRALARPMGVGAIEGQPIKPDAIRDLRLTAQEQHPGPCSRQGISTSHAASGSAVRAKLAEFTRNRPKGPTWID
jgi:hypothetical protein